MREAAEDLRLRVQRVEAAGAGGPESGRWPAAALEVLDRAEALLRQGDWQGFGAALQELRTLLEGLGAAPAPPGR